MKKFLTICGLLAATFGLAQFTTGEVSLPTTGMTIQIDTTPTTVTMTVTGDSNSMLGIGFGNSGMAMGADGFIFNSTSKRDYTFQGVGITPMPDSSQDWTEVSNTVSGNTRIIVATRSLAGDPEDYTFLNDNSSISIFYSKRQGNQSLGYHESNRDYAVLARGQMGTAEINNVEQFAEFYPNPTKDYISFKNPEKIQQVQIFDATGKSFNIRGFENNKLNVSNLNQGVYYLVIKMKDGKTVSKKVIKK